jgi:hypothetical protein
LDIQNGINNEFRAGLTKHTEFNSWSKESFSEIFAKHNNLKEDLEKQFLEEQDRLER